MARGGHQDGGEDGGRVRRLLQDSTRHPERLAREAAARMGQFGYSTVSRVADRSVRLAITGLSRSGKTVAATALVHNLLRAADHPELLPFLSVVAERRLIGARLVDRTDLHLPSFPYRQVLASLTGDPANWPQSTDSINRSRLAVRFRPKGGLARLARPHATLRFDIVDYPGEWLLDLPMLQLSFAEWSAKILERLQRPPRAELSRSFTEFLAGLDPDAAADEDEIARGTAIYRDFLLACRDGGLSLLQPGRFVAPGHEVSTNAPAMRFFPLHPGSGRRRGLRGALEHRYDAYRDILVRPFYRQHFARAERQIVLVDVLKALTGGAHTLADMREALGLILRSFDHGTSGWLRRAVAPRIDRVLFAATKCDHVPVDQQANLKSLLKDLVAHSSGDIRFQGARTDAIAIAAVRCTEDVRGDRDGTPLAMVYGLPRGREKPTALYPGRIPPHFPAPQDWAALNLTLFDFLPFGLGQAETAGLPHVGLDRALDFLIGDRLR